MNKNATSDKAHERGRDQFGMSPEEWAALDALTDEQVHAAALADPDAQPLTDEQLARMRRISPARFIRRKMRMTREAFSAAYGIPADILRAWERHEIEPSAAELSYLRAIQNAPEAVADAVRAVIEA